MSKLPSGYTELQYIQSTGTQYIDTGYTPTANAKVFADFQMTQIPSSNSDVFGVKGQFSFRSYSGKNFRTVSGSAADFATTVSMTERHTVEKNMTLTTVDGSITVTTTTATISSPLFLCAYNNGSGAANYGYLKLYSCQIYDDDALIRDFVPCVNPSGEIGLYDLVSGAFYGNVGTGGFLAGPRRVKLPAGYTQTEYIQSSGSQYIDTGFKSNQNSRIVFDFTPVSVGQTHLFGSRSSNSSSDYFLTLCTGGYYRDDYAADKVVSDVAPSGRIIINKDKNTAKIGEKSYIHTAATFSGAYSIFLFGSNTGGSLSAASSLKLQTCQIYDNGTLVRDFIPCKDASGAVGLYDLVEAKFYANAGTGAFTAGDAIGWPVDEPPETPEGLTSPLAVALRWGSVSDSDRYNVYRDGKLLGSTTDTQYIDLTAGENETYTYTVTAVGDGGESDPAALVVYTRSGYYQYKPLIESATFL